MQILTAQQLLLASLKINVKNEVWKRKEETKKRRDETENAKAIEEKKRALARFFSQLGGADGARTRDPRRDRPVF